MYDKLAAIEERYVEIETLLVDPDVYQDPQYAAKLSKEQKELQPIVEVWRRYNAASQEHEEALAMLEGDLDSGLRTSYQRRSTPKRRNGSAS